MGFTHEFSWKQPFESFDKDLQKKIRRVLHIFHNKGIVQYELDNPDAPVANEAEIRFNGSREKDTGYETFFLDTKITGYNFIKTGVWNGKPYDFVVVMTLILIKTHSTTRDNFILDSDAFHVPETDPDFITWLRAIKYLNKLFKAKIKLDDIRPSKKELVQNAVSELSNKFSMPA